jgi:hypothetical protein
MKNIGIWMQELVDYLRELTKTVAPESEGSSPHSQQPANGPYPEPDECTLPPPHLFQRTAGYA